jgi:hypothetical protein
VEQVDGFDAECVGEDQDPIEAELWRPFSTKP